MLIQFPRHTQLYMYNIHNRLLSRTTVSVQYIVHVHVYMRTHTHTHTHTCKALTGTSGRVPVVAPVGVGGGDATAAGAVLWGGGAPPVAVPVGPGSCYSSPPPRIHPSTPLRSPRVRHPVLRGTTWEECAQKP